MLLVSTRCVSGLVVLVLVACCWWAGEPAAPEGVQPERAASRELGSRSWGSTSKQRSGSWGSTSKQRSGSSGSTSKQRSWQAGAQEAASKHRRRSWQAAAEQVASKHGARKSGPGRGNGATQSFAFKPKAGFSRARGRARDRDALDRPKFGIAAQRGTPAEKLAAWKAKQALEGRDPAPLPPCLDAFDGTAGLPENIIYVKVPKTGGSTFGGVMRRVGCRHGYSDVYSGVSVYKIPDRNVEKRHSVFAHHTRLSGPGLQALIPLRPGAAVVTLIRHPTTRCLSYIYHFVLSRRDVSEEEQEKAKWNGLHQSYCKDGQLVAIAARAQPDSAKKVVHQYDFVALTERFDESLVVLAERWGIPLVDMLYTKTKDHSTASDEDVQGETLWSEEYVVHKPLSEESARIQEYVNGPDFKQENALEFEVYELASRKLDEEVSKIADFDARLSALREMLGVVEDKCANDASAEESCLWRDNGCAQACIDHLIVEHRWDQQEPFSRKRKSHHHAR